MRLATRHAVLLMVALVLGVTSVVPASAAGKGGRGVTSATIWDGDVPVDDTTVDGPVTLRATFEGTPDAVAWHLDGRLYRDDDLDAPYTLTYARGEVPVREPFTGPSGLVHELGTGEHEVRVTTTTRGKVRSWTATFTVAPVREVTAATIWDGDVPVDGTTVDGPVTLRATFEGTPDAVAWHLDGRLYRDDDLDAPYTLTYARGEVPVREPFTGPSGLVHELGTGEHEVRVTTTTDGVVRAWSATFTVSPEGTDEPDDALSWAPPAGWQDYERLVLPPDGGKLFLDNGTDYVVDTQHRVDGPVELVGGRDIVWIGGHVRIGAAPSPIGHGPRRGLVLRDKNSPSTRTIHVEGLRIDGDGLAEGIDVDVPSAVVQVQNVHVGLVRFVDADDRDGTGPWEGLGRNHPDVLQTYGGHRELRVDGLTGRTAYQGLFFKEDHDDAPNGPVHLRRVDVEAVEVGDGHGNRYAANRLYLVDVDRSGDQYVETGTVWVDGHRNGGKVWGVPNPRSGSGSWWHGAYRSGDRLVPEPPPGTATFADALERKDPDDRAQATVATDALGRYGHWPSRFDASGAARILDHTGTAPGRVYDGAPPEGDYVPLETVGLQYVSPGYR